MTTFSDPVIQRVSIEAFRGFRDFQEFDVAGSAVVFSGPNGTGKTSFFDALQWVLLGKLERLEDIRTRRKDEHIVNQWRLGHRAFVEVEMIIRGVPVRLRRTGDHKDSTLECDVGDEEPLFGHDAQQRLRAALGLQTGVSLEMALITSGLMQQDVMRAVLEAKASERYAHISSVLGLGALEDFEDAAEAASKAAAGLLDNARADHNVASERLRQAIAQREQAERRERTRPPVETFVLDTMKLAKEVSPGLEVNLQGRIDSAGFASETLLQVLSFRERFEGLSRSVLFVEEQQGQLPERPDPAVLEQVDAAKAAALEAVKKASQEVDQRKLVIREVEAASEAVARLAAEAIPLLSKSCPVCGQHIDPVHVEHELKAKASGSEHLIALRTEADEAAEALATAETQRGKAEADVADAERIEREWKGLDSQVSALRKERRSLSAMSGAVVVTDIDVALANDQSVLDFLDRLQARLVSLADIYDRSPEAGILERAVAEIGSYESALEKQEARLKEANKRSTQASRLSEASQSARQRVARDRVQAIRPLVADIYSRLDPHPAFKTVEFELDTYYRQGTTTPLVKDVLEDITADPLMVMSTSQANIMALSYFLAMGWVAGDSALPFVLLDDPLQSMDDVNVLGFADLFRHLRKRRQLLVSTHERRFANLLTRKLAPRDENDRTIHFRFLGWDRSGPSFERDVIQPEMIGQPVVLVEKAG